jgi:Transposase IS200 like
MTRVRSETVAADRPGTYHLITRCVRRERLLDRGERKEWLCRGLVNWLSHMGIDLLAYAVMGNHLHLVVRLRPDVVTEWDRFQVARHALAVLPVRSGPGLEPLTVTKAIIERYADNEPWLVLQRQRLSSPSWLLRLVKQEIARRANQEDNCTGHFWENRFTSVVLLDAAATLACMVYVDLNQVRAGMVRNPVDSEYTSIRHRFARSMNTGRADHESVDASLGRRLVAMPQCAPHDWLSGQASTWSISESEYVALVALTARASFRDGRSAVKQTWSAVEALGLNPAAWCKTMARGGAMSGSVAGGPEARRRWCDAVGQSWAADKSGLW